MDITNIEYIKEIARLLNENGLSKISVRETSAEIILEKTRETQDVIQKTPSPRPEDIIDNKCITNGNIFDFNTMIEIKSPLIGVFYIAPSPEAEPFVRLGDTVKKGDVLCIIEAMKLLNEITAEQDGKIVDICINNGDVVEFGQVLFKMA